MALVRWGRPVDMPRMSTVDGHRFQRCTGVRGRGHPWPSSAWVDRWMRQGHPRSTSIASSDAQVYAEEAIHGPGRLPRQPGKPAAGVDRWTRQGCPRSTSIASSDAPTRNSFTCRSLLAGGGRPESFDSEPARPAATLPPPSAATHRRFDPLSPGGRLNVSGSLPATFCGKATGT